MGSSLGHQYNDLWITDIIILLTKPRLIRLAV